MKFLIYLFTLYPLVFWVPITQADNVIVLTDNAHPVTNLPEKVRLIKLDEAEHLHEQLSANLPTDPQQATKIAKERLATSGNKLQQALQNVVDAWALGISKIPAVVIDNYVVYGVNDVGRAVTLIENYREQRQ